MKKETNFSDFFLGVIVFALGGTIILNLSLGILSGLMRSQYFNLTYILSIFVGMLLLGAGLFLLIRAAK